MDGRALEYSALVSQSRKHVKEVVKEESIAYKQGGRIVNHYKHHTYVYSDPMGLTGCHPQIQKQDAHLHCAEARGDDDDKGVDNFDDRYELCGCCIGR